MTRNFQASVVDVISCRFHRKSVSICQNMRRHILEERVPNIHCCDKLKVLSPLLPVSLFPVPQSVSFNVAVSWQAFTQYTMDTTSAVLRRRSAATRLLGLRVRIPPGAWMSLCCECYVLSGIGLCDGLITRPEESYRLWCVVECDLETS